MASELIRNLIDAIDIDVIFCTRQFLYCGKRGAVDMALSRMVGAGLIDRVARGVFVKSGSAIPSFGAIAGAKARAFGKTIATEAADIASDLGLLPGVEQMAFALNGSTSWFYGAGKLIKMHGAARRKLELDKNIVGQGDSSCVA